MDACQRRQSSVEPGAFALGADDWISGVRCRSSPPPYAEPTETKVPHGPSLTPRSLERCLTQPVALRPDDLFEGILVRFLANLKPGIKQLK